MTIETLRSSVQTIAAEYPIKKVTLFGSRADGSSREDSDVDLIMEFSLPVSLLTLSIRFEERHPFRVSFWLLHKWDLAV